jgi:hypothetical protein
MYQAAGLAMKPQEEEALLLWKMVFTAFRGESFTVCSENPCANNDTTLLHGVTLTENPECPVRWTHRDGTLP